MLTWNTLYLYATLVAISTTFFLCAVVLERIFPWMNEDLASSFFWRMARSIGLVAGAASIIQIPLVAYLLFHSMYLEPSLVTFGDRDFGRSLLPLKDPDIGVQTIIDHEKRLVNVYYATNRSIEADAVPTHSSFQRSTKLSFGHAVIRIPDTHSEGRVERPKSIRLAGRLVTLPESEERHFVIRTIAPLQAAEFTKSVMQKSNKKALIFVHGFANTFHDALFKLAQIVWDYQTEVVPVAFSWPSKGEINPISYNYDQYSARFSRESFLQLIEVLYKDAKIEEIHVIAHSMGNEIVLDSLLHLKELELNVTVSEVILAAPDVDRDIFERRAPRLRDLAKGITLYASSVDRALLVSKEYAGGVPRAGDVPSGGPVLIEGIQTIDVSAIGTDLFGLGHGTYADNRLVIADIARLVASSVRPPHKRTPTIHRVPPGSDEPRYWIFPK